MKYCINFYHNCIVISLGNNELTYCDVLLSQQMLPAIKCVAEHCLQTFTKQYVAYGEICHFFVFCDFPR